VSGGAPHDIEGARFYLDEDVPHGAAAIGNELGMDVIAARDAQPSLPRDDAVHLAGAGANRRIMVACNRDDFLVATRDAYQASAAHAGLLILTRKLPREPARIAHALDRWVAERQREGGWPMQRFEVAFLSG